MCKCKDDRVEADDVLKVTVTVRMLDRYGNEHIGVGTMVVDPDEALPDRIHHAYQAAEDHALQLVRL